MSASLLAYLEPFAADLGIDHVIAVGFDEDADGRLTGRLTGPNVRGPEKAVRLRVGLRQLERRHRAAGHGRRGRVGRRPPPHPSGLIRPGRDRPPRPGPRAVGIERVGRSQVGPMTRLGCMRMPASMRIDSALM